MVAERQREIRGSGGQPPPNIPPRRSASADAEPADPRSPQEKAFGATLVDALRNGATVADLAKRFADGSITGLMDAFDLCCDQRMLRNSLRLMQYETAFRLERLKRQALERLFAMAMGEIVPESGSAEGIREIDFQRRAIVAFLGINAFPRAREIREDQRIASLAREPALADLSHQGVIDNFLRERTRAENASVDARIRAATPVSPPADVEESARRRDGEEVNQAVEQDSREHDSHSPPPSKGGGQVEDSPWRGVGAEKESSQSPSAARGEARAHSASTPQPPGAMQPHENPRTLEPKSSAAPPRPSRIVLTGRGTFLRGAEGTGSFQNGATGDGPDIGHPP